jgi:hypothetical protein
LAGVFWGVRVRFGGRLRAGFGPGRCEETNQAPLPTASRPTRQGPRRAARRAESKRAEPQGLGRQNPQKQGCEGPERPGFAHPPFINSTLNPEP